MTVLTLVRTGFSGYFRALRAEHRVAAIDWGRNSLREISIQRTIYVRFSRGSSDTFTGHPIGNRYTFGTHSLTHALVPTRVPGFMSPHLHFYVIIVMVSFPRLHFTRLYTAAASSANRYGKGVRLFATTATPGDLSSGSIDEYEWSRTLL